MHRFFVDKSQVKGDIAFISGDDAKHLEKVLRLKEGDTIEVVVGEEQEYLGKVITLKGKSHEVKLLESVDRNQESSLKITLYQGLPKASKMELIIQKAVELGVNRIVPVMNARSVVQLKTEKDQQKKQERWQKIAYEAAKQSKRLLIPEVALPMEFNEVIKNLSEEVQVVAYEDEKTTGLKDLPFMIKDKDQQASVPSIGLWVGPEGGFSKDEISTIKAKEGYAVTLGPRILRTETAGLTLISIVQYECGDLGG